MALPVIMLALSIILTTAGQLFIKKGALGMPEGMPVWRVAIKSRWTLAGLGCALISPVVYIIALRDLPLSVAWPAAASMYVFVTVGAHCWFKEPMNIGAWTGLALIVAGVVIIGLG